MKRCVKCRVRKLLSKFDKYSDLCKRCSYKPRKYIKKNEAIKLLQKYLKKN